MNSVYFDVAQKAFEYYSFTTLEGLNNLSEYREAKTIDDDAAIIDFESLNLVYETEYYNVYQEITSDTDDKLNVNLILLCISETKYMNNVSFQIAVPKVNKLFINK